MKSFKEQLSQWCRENKVQRPKSTKNVHKKKKKKSEHLSSRDLADLMGTNRKTYERRGGAIRQR